MKELKDGHEYDDLYLAAKARSEADWLVGINGTQALTVAAGRGNVFRGTRTDTHAGNGLQAVPGKQTLYAGASTPAAFLRAIGKCGYGGEIRFREEMAGQERGSYTI